ncbi:MAG: hypothetical protein M3O25_00200 [Actinomycetota bacterium]|nr:hypothetical protein [Actinomycetota bacterium]
MTVLISMEFPATADQYDQVNEALGEEPPDGLILHSATDMGGTMRIVDVWESADKFAAFGERLGPIVESVMGAGGASLQPDIQELHNLEVHQTA